MLIVIAGADGSGKSTVSAIVREKLASLGVVVRRRDKWDVFDREAQPACRFLHGPLSELRSCISAMPVPARTAFLFWTFHMTMRTEVLAGPGWTLVDSYWYKHAASEIIYGAPPDLVAALGAPLTVPDKVYLLDVPVEEAWRRKASAGFADLVPYECGMSETLSRESFLAHQSRLRRQLLDWAARDAWSVIDASGTAAATADAIVDNLRGSIASLS